MSYSMDKIKCPYYENGYYKPNRQTIKCEGCTRFFKTENAKNEYFTRYCQNDWEKCEYAKTLNEIYDNGGDSLELTEAYLEEQCREFYILYSKYREKTDQL